MIQKFLDYIAIERRYSPRTVGEYGDDLKAWCAFLGWEVKDFDPSRLGAEDVKLWMIDMLDNGQSPRSVKRRLSAVKSLYKFLLRVGLVKVDITRAIVAPKADKPLPIYFREGDMEAVKVNQARDWDESMSEEEQMVHVRDYLIVEMLYQTGMRRAELVGVKEVDVDVKQQQVRVFGKRAKERIIPMGEALCELIEEYRAKKSEILGDNDGIGTFLVRKNRKGEWQEMDAHTLYNIVRARMGEVSTLKKHSPHVLRHTFATTMLNNGADIRTIQSLLGHASLAATQIYSHATFEHMKEAYDATHPRSIGKKKNKLTFKKGGLMKLNMQAVNFEIAERLEKHIEKKTKRYEKLLPESAEMEIRMTVVKPETNLNKETAIRVIGFGSELFAQKVCDTFEEGVDDCLEAIEKQLEKRKDK